MSWSGVISRRGILRHSAWDALLILLALLQGLALVLSPSIALVGLGLWWNANTVSHNFIHLPFFRSRRLNFVFSAYLSLLLGLPQTLWKERHLAHHSKRPWTLRVRPQLTFEASLVLGFWGFLWWHDPEFVLFTYLPGFALGLFLCFLQGHFEHSAGTASHYGPSYNALFFNDGFHREHHAFPARHWRILPSLRTAPTANRWPAVLRWLDTLNLDNLERLVLHSAFLQRWVLRRHENALRRLWGTRTAPRQIVVIGGGLFPRTTLIVHRLWPEAEVTVVEASADHISCAQKFLNRAVHFRCAHYDCTRHDLLPEGLDLLIVPLAFRGLRENVYRCPPARQVLVHDWLWHRQGETTRVSWALLKRMNLVEA